jgi:biotin carboxylase
VAWLDAALEACARRGYDVLFPTQEQVTVLAACPGRLRSAGVRTAVPAFAAVAAVQDKVAARRTLHRLGLPQPDAVVATSAADLAGGLPWYPAYLKEPIGTATSGVHHVETAAQLAALAGSGRLDAMFETDGGPVVIDVNPRIVEPANAQRSGTDLTRALLDVATGEDPDALPPGQPDVRTHQLLLAVLGAAQQGRGRRGVARELRHAARGTGDYAGSADELGAWRHDLRAVVPTLLPATAALVAPSSWRWFAAGSVTAYALTASAWRTIQALAERDGN